MIPDNWPQAFVERMRDWLADEADALFAAMNKREVGLRLNPRRGDVAALRVRLSQAGWETSPVPWCPAGAWMPEDEIEDAPGKHPYHTAGVYYLQDPSAMAAGVILDPRPGEWVILAWCVPLFAFLGTLYAKYPRYLLVLTPALALFAARLLDRLAQRWRWGRGLPGLVLSATLVHTLVVTSLYAQP